MRVAGSGPLVIMMHGWPELGLSYRHQLTALAKGGYTVATPDMRGYGGSSKPHDADAYSMDANAVDMAAIAEALGAKRWVAVGHDMGSQVAWRSALRFPDSVAAVFSLSIPHRLAAPMTLQQRFQSEYADRFFYIRYFMDPGVAEKELERDPRDALKRIYFSLSGDAPLGDWTKHRPLHSPLLEGLSDPPHGPLSFMSNSELDVYAQHFAAGGFGGPLSWYRVMDVNAEQGRRYGNQHIVQPAGFLCGEKEIAILMIPGGIERQRELCDDLRMERILPGAGHWIQQERPDEVSEALLEFLRDVRSEL